MLSNNLKTLLNDYLAQKDKGVCSDIIAVIIVIGLLVTVVMLAFAV